MAGPSDTSALAGALASPNMRAFLAVLRAGEGTSDEDGYRRMFGGKLFAGYADHPRQPQTYTLAGKPLTSTAAGAYQFLSRTWDGLVRQYALPDFSPASQDLGAVALIKGRNALADVLAGNIAAAIAKCAKEWASLPGSPYGQPTRTMAQAMAVYDAAGGTNAPTSLAPAPAPSAPTLSAPTPSAPLTPSEAPVPLPLFLAAALPSIVESIPKLAKLFGSGSDVSERNIKAAELAIQVVQEATGSKNAQEAVETLKADPTSVAAATAAIESRWYELAEVGGGGIDGARKADAAAVASGQPVWSSPSFVVTVLLLPLVYMIVGSLIGVLGSVQWSDEVRASLATGIVTLIVGGAAGYFWGATTTRNRVMAQP